MMRLRLLVPLALAAIAWGGALPAQRPSAAAAAVERDGRGKGTIVADTLWSQALGIRKQFIVWLPPSYDGTPARRYPVAYYLHGLWGDEWNWSRQGRIGDALDSLVAAGMPELIVVMPDGDDGWWTTWNSLGSWAECRRQPPEREAAASYCVPWPHYDDYVARDLVARVDSAYRTRPGRAHRAIAGLSMGGYGAVSLALRYPDVFSAAASHSGVLAPMVGEPAGGAPRPVTEIDELRAGYRRMWPLIAPAFGKDTAAWASREPARLAEQLVARDRSLLPALFLDVGVDDRLVAQNRWFRAALRRLDVPHAYAEWPGAHTWDYWRAHVPESLRWIAARIAADGDGGGGRDGDGDGDGR